MLVFDEYSKPMVVDSIYTPTSIDYFWILDLAEADYTLTSLDVLEETIGPCMELMISGFKFFVPATWHLLVIDEESSQLDVCQVGELSGKDFKTLVYGPDMYRPKTELVTVVGYKAHELTVGPSLNKNQMLCHPISATEWVNIAPSDTYNKFLKKMLLGDLI